MVVGAARVELHVHGSQSLKQKRGVVRAISQRVRNRFNRRGREVLATYTPLEISDLDWVMVAEIDLEEATAIANRLSRTLLITSAVVTVGLLIALSWFLRRQVLSPVSRLLHGAREMASGRYDTRIGLRRRDEFGALSDAFDHMAAAISAELKERQQALKSLEQSEEKFRRIYETMADGYFRRRLSDGRLVDANPAAANILGYPSVEAFMERRTTELYATAGDRAQVVERLQQSEEFQGLEIEMVTLRRRGGPAPPQRQDPARRGATEPALVETNFFDLSAQKKAEVALEERARLAAERRKPREEHVSREHEPRAPHTP